MFRNYGEGQDGTVDGGKMGIKLGVSALAEKIGHGLEGHTLKFRHQSVIKIVYYTEDKQRLSYLPPVHPVGEGRSPSIVSEGWRRPKSSGAFKEFSFWSGLIQAKFVRRDS